ncbi:MAG: PEGA domain-containing protein [Candidatus Woesebacteria bacterium]|nr:PEGA domain-containing protein [Candidatus Woesebacteria bacterium]
MTKIRVIFFLITLIVVGGVGIFASYYARGYRYDLKTFKFQPNGLLVLKSEPDGASVYVDGNLKTATNASISISPGTYDVEVRKDGYFSWYKRLTIEKEIVTQTSISLFKNVPSLSPVTSVGVVNPVMSEDGAKIVYSTDKTGLWTLDTFSLPLGFGAGPKRITDGDMTGASYIFSPDGRQVLLSLSNSVFLIDTGSFIAQKQRVNIASTKSATNAGWAIEKANKNQNLIKNLPPELTDILARKSLNFVFSPDSNMILYTASSSGTLPEGLVRPLPGASTQRQERNIEAGRSYVYDIKEDRNFLITDQPVTINNTDNPQMAAVRWMSSSRHLLLAQSGQVVVIDYDGTNRQIVYSGSYFAPAAFPFSNTTKLLILTNLGAPSANANLYTLTVK